MRWGWTGGGKWLQCTKDPCPWTVLPMEPLHREVRQSQMAWQTQG